MIMPNFVRKDGTVDKSGKHMTNLDLDYKTLN